MKSNATTKKLLHAIMRDLGRLSYSLIAEKHGLTRNAVAGVVFRHKHPPSTRISSPNAYGSPNKIGGGRRGGIGSYWPQKHLRNTR